MCSAMEQILIDEKSVKAVFFAHKGAETKIYQRPQIKRRSVQSGIDFRFDRETGKMRRNIKLLAGICIFVLLCNTGSSKGCNAVEHEIPQKRSVWQHYDLKTDEMPPYDFFLNAGEGGYHILLENDAACAVKDYAKKAGIKNEKWILKRILYRDNHYHAYVRSETGNIHLFLLIDGEWDANERYVVMADVREGGNAEIKLPYSNESYNSSLAWDSYKEYFDGNKEPSGDYRIDGRGELFDGMYDRAGSFAMYAYLDSVTGEKSCEWTIDQNSAYMGGAIADISFTDGRETVSMLIDVSNKTYSVLDESILSVD